MGEIVIIDHMSLISTRKPSKENEKAMAKMHETLHDLMVKYNIKPLLNFSKMNKAEAIEAMKAGKKVTHYHFSPEEWMTMENGQIVLEDGVRCSPYEFWRWRTDKSWEEDYSLYTK